MPCILDFQDWSEIDEELFGGATSEVFRQSLHCDECLTQDHVKNKCPYKTSNQNNGRPRGPLSQGINFTFSLSLKFLDSSSFLSGQKEVFYFVLPFSSSKQSKKFDDLLYQKMNQNHNILSKMTCYFL